ncbi:MAG: class I SAM-dependent methyltransferase [Deltaproteobacteria bacterium]|nr:class I SAM-dependent methyltransferase [Deltaproteobacteria bacterium]
MSFEDLGEGPTEGTDPSLFDSIPEIQNAMDMAPDARTSAMMERWDELSATQGERGKTTAWTVTSDRLQTEFLTSHPELNEPGAVVIDIGCGVGDGANVLRQAGVDVIGTDCSEMMLDLARGCNPPYSRLIQHSIIGETQLAGAGIAPNSVKGIVSYGAMQSFPDSGDTKGEFDEEQMRKALNQMHYVLEADGVVSLAFLPPQEKDFHALTTVIDPDRLAQIMKEEGFEITKNEAVPNAYDHDQGKGQIQYHLIEARKLAA